MSKVPLHVYEKVRRREKLIKGIGTGLLWLGGGFTVLLGLAFVGLICYAVWTAGGGGVLICLAVGGGLLGTYVYVAANDQEVLEQARREGVIDE